MNISIRLPLLVLVAAASFFAPSGHAQQAASQPATPDQSAAQPAAPQTAPAINIPSDEIRSAMDRLSQAISQVNVSRWKASGDVKAATLGDLGSIQRNLTATLPTLLNQAQAAPGAVAPAFALYRNLSALYDVVLRVCQVGMMAGSSQDASLLEDSRTRLDAARKDLGVALFQAASDRDAELARLRAAAAAAAQAAAAPAASKHIVVDDGPAASKRKKKPAPKP